jgi:hypothetical protein
VYRRGRTDGAPIVVTAMVLSANNCVEVGGCGLVDVDGSSWSSLDVEGTTRVCSGPNGFNGTLVCRRLGDASPTTWAFTAVAE